VPGQDAGWSVSLLQRGMCLGEEIVPGDQGGALRL
jgi:hypothetical protein